MSQGSFVSAQDYNGFGQSTPGEVADLQKALSAGHDINNPGTAPGGGFPLRMESLESSMKSLDGAPTL